MRILNPFHGKTAFVSGASSGIGRAIAEEFGRRGLRVVLASRQLADVERVAAGIPGASAVRLDVRDEANWIAALDTAEAVRARTNGYEILTNLGDRYHRLYSGAAA